MKHEHEKARSLEKGAGLRLSKTILHVPKIEQRESARGQGPSRSTITRRRKALKIKAFRAKQHFDNIKMLGG